MTDKDSFRAKKLEILRSFCLFDDAFFSKCLDGGNECVELILSIILGRNDLKVVNTRTQENSSRMSRSILLLSTFLPKMDAAGYTTSKSSNQKQVRTGRVRGSIAA